MDVNLNHSIKPLGSTESQQVEQPDKIKPLDISGPQLTEQDVKQTIDKATGLLQTVISEKFSDEIIRKMPPDDYLKMLSLLDNIISGSIDESI